MNRILQLFFQISTYSEQGTLKILKLKERINLLAEYNNFGSSIGLGKAHTHPPSLLFLLSQWMFLPSQRSPPSPLGHKHMQLCTSSIHVPSFTQGLLSHSSISAENRMFVQIITFTIGDDVILSQSVPVKPLAHLHVNEFILSIHRAPF